MNAVEWEDATAGVGVEELQAPKLSEGRSVVQAHDAVFGGGGGKLMQHPDMM